MPREMSGLELWLQEGRNIRIGPKTFLLLPMPISKFRKLRDWLDTTSKDVILQALKNEQQVAPWGLIIDVIKQVDVYDLCFTIFDRKNPDTGEPINQGLTKEFLEEYLSTPVLQNIIKEFIEINDLREALKNLQSLPIMGPVMEALKSTFGLPFLTHLATSTDSPQPKLEGSASLSSTSTSEDSTSGTQVGGQANRESKPQYKM